MSENIGISRRNKKLSKEGPTSICIFSRNRPLQLHALLKSLKTYVYPLRDVTVLYRYDEKYQPALNEVKEQFQGYKFIEDDNFKQQVCLFLESAGPTCFFLVDDIIFRRPVDNNFCTAILDHNPDMLTFSLRMGLHLTYCYPVNQSQAIPDGYIQNQLFLWSWRNAQCDWNYPFSVDGHIFRSKQLLSYTRHLDFHHPNSFEAEMQKIQFTFAVPSACVCHTESCLFNNPLNRVQNDFENRSGNITTEDLLAKWDEGLEIDIKKLAKLIPNAAHTIAELPLKERT